MKYDLLIKNGTVVDGTGGPRYCRDIAIKDGIVSRIEAGISSIEAEKTIDATGKIVAPGVIDLHTHYDAQVHWDPYCTSSGWHGVTTVVVGNCGFGFAPCRPEDRERYMLMMEHTEQVPINAMKTALSWDWVTFPEWLKHLKTVDKGVNMASFLPLNPLMIYVMGVDAAKSRPATDEERQRMKEYLFEALDAGAIGFAFSYQGTTSSHVDYDGSPMPTDTMSLDDVYYLASALGERDQGVIQALVDIPGTENTEVAVELARLSKRPVIHNMTMIIDAFPSFHKDIYKMLDSAEEEGLSIYSSGLTLRTWTEFRAGDYTLWDVSAVLREFSTSHNKLEMAANADFRSRVRNSYDTQMMAGTGSDIQTFILKDANGATEFSGYTGQSVRSIADALGSDFIDVFFDILVASELQADFATESLFNEDPVLYEEMFRQKRLIPGISDGGAHPKFGSGGYFSTDAITWMCRDEKRISLEEMHYKLSGLPAQVVGLHNRGYIKEGYAADIYIYDLDELGYIWGKYEVLHDLPDGDWRRAVYAQGIEWVVTNGVVTFKDGVASGKCPGELLGNSGQHMDTTLQQAAKAPA